MVTVSGRTFSSLHHVLCQRLVRIYVHLRHKVDVALSFRRDIVPEIAGIGADAHAHPGGSAASSGCELSFGMRKTV